MTTATPHLKYRAAIDGLRAIAVISVYLFHLNKDWLPGGFVGVDVFFVISGYLITSIILKDLQKSQFSLLAFYQRRIARIFPAFFAVGLVTIAAASVVYSSQDFASAGALLSAAALSIVNVKLMFQGNYFTVSLDSQPFLHYWSLSLEEQFYVFFPVLFLLLYKCGRKFLSPVLWCCCVISFIACVVMTNVRPTWAFYLLPTRAWELFAGCLLAVHTDGQPISKMRWPGTIGLLLIVLSLVFVPEGSGFPGYWALLPVLATVGVLMAPPTASSERWLSLPLLVHIGRMSYSLYLWHWPVFSLVDYRMLLASESTRLIIKIVLSVSAATLSFWLIENPARRLLNQQRYRSLAYVFFVCSMVVCAPLGIFIRNNQYIAADFRDVRNGGLVFPGSPKEKSVLLMGDSNGAMYGKLLRELCKQHHSRLVVTSVPAGNPLPSAKNEPRPLWLDSLAVVKKEKPDCLVLACDWSGKLQRDDDSLAVAINELLPHIGKLVLIEQLPRLPDGINRTTIRHGQRPPFYEDANDRTRRHEMDTRLQHLKSDRCQVVTVEAQLTQENGEVLFFDQAGRQIFHDRGHLSGAGADLIRSELEQAIYGEIPQK